MSYRDELDADRAWLRRSNAERERKARERAELDRVIRQRRDRQWRAQAVPVYVRESCGGKIEYRGVKPVAKLGEAANVS